MGRLAVEMAFLIKKRYLVDMEAPIEMAAPQMT